LIFWHKILDWAEASLFPWVERQFPLLLDTVKNAFVFLDKFTSPTRLAIKKSWEKLREYLLKQVIQIEKDSSNQWVKKVTSWVAQILDNGQIAPVRVETEEYIPYEELPQDVREAWIRRQERIAEFNVTELRDQEFTDEDEGMIMAT
jgi:hypothetical protein